MDWQTIEDQCLKANKFFGQLVGVWPNQEKFTKIIIRFVIFVIIIATITAQISRVVVFYSLEVLSDQMPYLDIGLVILIKQYNYILNEKKLKGLLNDIVADRLIERPKEELEILDMYSKKATFLSCLYQVSISFCACMFVLLPTIPPILNVVAPLNESRSREFIYPSYYFVDEQQYYYPILVHMISVAVILTSVYIACDINLVHVVHHGCALFAISGGLCLFVTKYHNDDYIIGTSKCMQHKTTIEEEYMKVVKICTMVVGIWPDQRKFSKFVMQKIIHVHCCCAIAYYPDGKCPAFFQPGYADGADLFFVCGSRNIDEINFYYNIIPFLRTIQYNTSIQQYYYPILARTTLGASMLTAVYITCDINLVHFVHHGCALLVIGAYRFKHAVDNVSFSNEKYLDVLLDETYAKISRSIDAHKKAVEYVDKVDACHVHYFFIILGLIIVTFTSTFVRLSTMEIGVRYFTFCAFTISQMTHLLFLTIMGQFLINSNDETFQAICEAKWYNGSSKAQSLYLLVLRKCLSPPKLTGGGVVSLNLESFVQVLKASFSYYTVFRSS